MVHAAMNHSGRSSLHPLVCTLSRPCLLSSIVSNFLTSIEALSFLYSSWLSVYRTSSEAKMDINMLPEKAPETSSTNSPSSLEHGKADGSYVSDDSIDLTDKAAERRLLLKLDLYVLPVLFLLFLVSFVDRSNVANARIQGLEKSLGIDPKSNGYNVALFSFTIPYVLFEVPANITLKKIKPQWWLSGLMFSWGKCGFVYHLE